MKFKEYLKEPRTPLVIGELSMARDTKIDKRESGDVIEFEIELENGEKFYIRITKEHLYSHGLNSLFGDAFKLVPLKDNEKIDKWSITFQDSWRRETIAPKEKGISLQLFAAIEKSLTNLIKIRKPHILKYAVSDSSSSRRKLYNMLAKKIQKTGKYKQIPSSFSLGGSGKYYFIRTDLISESLVERLKKYLVQEKTDPPKMGINVRNEKGNRFADLIVDGRKYYETRETNSLKPYIGKRIAIVRTGEGQAMAIGEVTIGKPLHVTSKEEFDKLRPKHLVPDDSKFGFKTEKYLYPMLKPMRYQKEYRVRAKGIISRQIPYFLIKLVE